MKKHFIQVFNYWLALFLFTGILSGQSNIIDQYIAQALANNLSIKTHSFAKAQQSSRVEQARKLWNPNVDLTTTYLLAQGGRTILFPVGDLFNPVYGTLNQLTASESFPTNLENNEIQLTPNNFLDANLTISKPLINSSIKHNILIQEALLPLNDIDQVLEENELKFHVKQAYFNYLRTLKGEELLAENITLLEEVQAFNEKLIRYDKATPDVQSDVKFQITNLRDQLNAVREQRNITRHLFNTLLNRDLNEDIEEDLALLDNIPLNNFDLPQITQQALQSRPEFQKITVGRQVNELNQNRIDAEKLPTLGLSGGIGLQTEEFSFDEGGPLYTAAVSLGWNIFDGGLRKKRIEELKIEQESLELQNQVLQQQIALQVAQEYYNWRTKVANLQAQEAAIEAAQTSYNATFNRYRNDKAILIEVISAQNRLINSRLNKLLAVIDIHIAVAALEKTIFQQ